jgi:hypothetical protein
MENSENNVRNLVGFNTPSKALAQEEMNSNPQVQGVQMPTTNLEMLKMESAHRASVLGTLITTPAFNVYNQEQRTQILMDFAYFSKVAESL